jgi:spore coat polysaccharide biosynthesis protein SpsF
MKNLGFIIQARSGSKRLPDKVLLKIDKKNVLEHLISRIKKTKIKKKIIVATSSLTKDKKIIQCAKKNNCYYFSGDEKNVLKRYYYAAKKYNLNIIIRVSADSPFIDPVILEKAFNTFKSNKYDYVSNIIKPSFPKGMSVEIFSFDCLEKTFLRAKSNADKEHVTKFMYRKQSLFRTRNFGLKISLRRYKFAIDTKKDFLIAKKIYDKLKKAKKQYTYKLKDLVNCYKQIA